MWEIYGKYFLSEEMYNTTLENYRTFSPDKGRFSSIYQRKNLADFFLISDLPFLSLEASVKSWKRCLWSDLARYLFNTLAFILVSPSVPSWDIIQLNHFPVSGGAGQYFKL